MNGSNKDGEIDETGIMWEIPRDWSKKYFRRNTVMKSKRPSLVCVELCNHRKQMGNEGELLVRWKDGRRDWSHMYAAYKDCGAKMVNSYLKSVSLSKEIMGHGLIAKKRKQAIEMQKKKLDYYQQNKKQKITGKFLSCKIQQQNSTSNFYIYH